MTPCLKKTLLQAIYFVLVFVQFHAHLYFAAHCCGFLNRNTSSYRYGSFLVSFDSAFFALIFLCLHEAVVGKRSHITCVLKEKVRRKEM